MLPGPWRYLLAGVLAMAGVLILTWGGKPLSRDALLGSGRAALQLLVVALLLGFVFRLREPWWHWTYIFIMTLIGARTAQRRVKGASYLSAWVPVLVASFLGAGSLVSLRVISPAPQELIPLAGMMVGNAVNAESLAGERFMSDLSQGRNIIEAAFALGATKSQALGLLRRGAVAAGTMSIRNTMRIIGLVQIPGAMVGMLMAGKPPLDAALLQLAIIWALLFSNSTAVCLFLFLKIKGAQTIGA